MRRNRRISEIKREQEVEELKFLVLSCIALTGMVAGLIYISYLLMSLPNQPLW